MFSRYKFFILLVFLMSVNTAHVAAQNADEKNKPEAAEKNKKPDNKQQANDSNKPVTAEQVAESAVLLYGNFGGRDFVKQIRKTTIERGKTTLVNAEGKTDTVSYERRILRGDSLDKERIRLDQEYPNARYALIYNDDKIFGLYNESVFTPREDAAKEFQNQIWHGLEALLRYKENGATLNLVGRDKMMGVEYYILDVTDKQNRTTKFYVSVKTLRVMMLEYTEDNIKYRRKFYDYNIAQGTLVPFRTVLWANDKQIEETEVQTISFGQKVEEDIFKQS